MVNCLVARNLRLFEGWHILVSAVLVIDAQFEILKSQPSNTKVQGAFQRINQVIAAGRKAGSLIIYIRNLTSNAVTVDGEEFAAFSSPFDVRASDYIVEKKTPDSFFGSSLEYLLVKLSVGSLYICGMRTECCVDATVRSALARGYPVFLVSDGHTTDDKAHLSAEQIVNHHNETLASISTYNARATVVPICELSFQ